MSYFYAHRVKFTTGGHQWQVIGGDGQKYGCVDGAEAKTWADRLNEARDASTKQAAALILAGAVVNDRLLAILRSLVGFVGSRIPLPRDWENAAMRDEFNKIVSAAREALGTTCQSCGHIGRAPCLNCTLTEKYKSSLVGGDNA